MTEQELVKKWLQPGAIVPVDANTTRILITALRERLAQPEQEPVAWMWKDGTVTADPDRADGTWTPLYTTPPRREWVGLTDDEIKALPQWFPSHETAAVMPLIRAIEAKLKEKNGRVDSFLRRLLDPEDLGHAVSHEVRQKVRELL